MEYQQSAAESRGGYHGWIKDMDLRTRFYQVEFLQNRQLGL